MTLPEPGPGLVSGSLAALAPAPPQRPVEHVPGRKLVSLTLNEGPDSPFPSALEAIGRAAAGVNRYPERGSYHLTAALAERHGLRFEEVVVAAGADALIGYTCQALLDPGDEIVTGWPSFPSFVRDALKRGATPVTVPLRDGRIELDGLLAAVTRRTKLAFVATPNNPTGTMSTRSELLSFVEQLPAHVLPVIDEAYFDYVEDPEHPDAIEEVAKGTRPALVLRTFSKLYGLAGLRVGYGVGPASVVEAIHKVQRGYDVGAVAQAAALASLGDTAEVARRRAANLAAVAELIALLLERGIEPLAPAAGNFVFVDLGARAATFVNGLERLGVLVQSTEAFGAPSGVRITAGTAEEHRTLAERLDELEFAKA